MADAKLDLMQGTLDLMVLQDPRLSWAPQHGYGLARRIEQPERRCGCCFNQGTIYAALRATASSEA